MEKLCKSCNCTKMVSDFYKRSGRGDGLAAYTHKCKLCVKKSTRENNEARKDYKKEYNKIYREKNREKLNDYLKKWRLENGDFMKECQKRYYQENKENVIKMVNDTRKKD